ncbi:MAG: hypothetical protein ABI664_02720 [bacterium]
MLNHLNSKAPNFGAPFEQGAISEEELENVVGGLARAWIEPLSPAPSVRGTPRDQSAWGSQTGPLET